MGFFDGIKDILGAALPIIGNVLLPGAGGALGVAVGGAIAGTPPLTQAVQTVGAFGGTQAGLQAAANVQAGLQAGACPTGSLRRRTLVQTFDPRTGAVMKQEIHAGAPAVFQSDVAAANRLNRALRRLNKKQPKKLIKQSQIAQLKDEVIEGALRSARDGNGNGKCPT